MRVTVGTHHIDKGLHLMTNPLILALQDCWPEALIIPTYDYDVVEFIGVDRITRMIRLPYEAEKFMLDYEVGAELYPIEFDLDTGF